MNEKFNKNAKVEKFTNMLGIAVRLIVIDPLAVLLYTFTISNLCDNIMGCQVCSSINKAVFF